MLVMGIDDAGRGPLIGPMFLAGVLLTPEQEKILKEEGINDSKTLTHRSRVRMASIIKKNCIAYSVVETKAQDIDEALIGGTNLNKLEALKCGMVVNELNNLDEKIEVIVDCPSVNTSAWCETMKGFVKNVGNLDFKCEHKADANHISVAAGSILAKVAREDAVDRLKEKFGDFGSGYPSDPKTKAFLKERGMEFSESGLFRKTWATWMKMYPESKGQKTLF